MPISTSGAISARSSSHQDQEHDQQHERRDHGRVPRGRFADVELHRACAADERPGRRPVRRVTDRVHEVEGLGRVRLRLERCLHEHAALTLGHGPGHRLDAVDALHGARDRGDVGLVGHDDVGRRAGAGREALAEQLLAVDRLDLGAVAVVRGQVGGEEGEAGASSRAARRWSPPSRAPGSLATTSPTRFQNPCVTSVTRSRLKRRSSYGLKIARSSGPKISDGIAPRGELAEQRVEEHERQQQRDEQARADHRQQRG